MRPVVGKPFRPSRGPTRILLSHASSFVWSYLPTNPQLYWRPKWKLWFSSSNEISFDLEMPVIVCKCKFRWCEVNWHKTDWPTWGRRSWLWDRLRLLRGRMRRQCPRSLRGPIRERSACKWWDVRYAGLPFLGRLLGWECRRLWRVHSSDSSIVRKTVQRMNEGELQDTWSNVQRRRAPSHNRIHMRFHKTS